MIVYTYVVKHQDPPPRLYLNQKIEGGTLIGCMFDNALEHVSLLEKLIERIQASTTCQETSDAIDSGMIKIDKEMRKRMGT